MNSKIVTGIVIFLTVTIIFPASAQVYMTEKGKATFKSNAPLELISAVAENLAAAINIDDNQFAFRIANKSFIGFNSQLQQEHFYENYIETEKFKYSTFQGKIIEKIDLSNPLPQQLRAKGTLSIHGVEQERIIKATVVVEKNKLVVYSEFTVPLEDHDIRIPNVVYKKIAELIDVEINAELMLKTN